MDTTVSSKLPDITLYKSPTGHFTGLTHKDRSKLIYVIDTPSFSEEKYDAAMSALKLYGIKDVRVIHRINFLA